MNAEEDGQSLDAVDDSPWEDAGTPRSDDEPARSEAEALMKYE